VMRALSLAVALTISLLAGLSHAQSDATPDELALIDAWVDQRVITTSFAAEETLTSDNVPVNVDAVLFWMVYDAEKAALEVQDYAQAVSWASQTALRDIIGRTTLTDLLRGREKIEDELQRLPFVARFT